MDLVRFKSGAAVAGDFDGSKGGAIVIDTATGLPYVTKADGTILAVGAGTYAPLASPTFTGVPAAPTAAATDDSTQIATTAHVKDYVYASTWTPTLSNTTNVAASTAYLCTYVVVGSVVHCFGRVDIDVTSALTDTVLGISIPVASDFANDGELAGTAAQEVVGTVMAAYIRADTANNRAYMGFRSVDATNLPWYFSFSYRVI